MPVNHGDRIGEWEVEARLGKGGVAEVYRCRNGDDVVALKRLRSGTLYNEVQAMRRLKREAEILTTLDHENIVRVRDVCIEDRPPWLVMDYVPGRSCSWYVRTGPASPPTALRVVGQLVEALAYCHERGIAHRDIKPANVLLAPPGRVVVVDFGLALDESLERLSARGVRLGTFAYMPPEWIVGDAESSPLSWDVYGAGQLLFELLTGTRAFDVRDSLGDLMRAKLARESLDPGDGIPDPVRALVRALTATDPADRPRDAMEARALWAKC